MKKMEKSKKKKKLDKYERWYAFLYTVVDFFYAGRKPDLYKKGGKLPEGGNLILANHVTRLDQFIVAFYYGKHSFIRFVSGENVFNKPITRWFATRCLNVIIHMRGVSAGETIREMTRSLKQGENVMIFPTGSMTFDGRSQKIDVSIAKLAKMSSCNLVLLRTDGGYLTQPRWGTNTRKGNIQLTEHVLSAEEIKNMSATDVLAFINEHLYTDAYEVQAKEHFRYSGTKLCKGLECCIYECPKCKKISGLRTNDSELSCSCGFNATYDDFGYLKDKDGREHTITELCDNQTKNLRDRFIAARNANSHELMFSDDFALRRLMHNGKRSEVGRISVEVYSDIIEIETDGSRKTIEYDAIESVFVYMRNTLNINLKEDGYGYECIGDFSFNALKYRDLHHIYLDMKRAKK